MMEKQSNPHFTFQFGEISALITWLVVMIWAIESIPADSSLVWYQYIPFFFLYALCFGSIIVEAKLYQANILIRLTLITTMVLSAFMLNYLMTWGFMAILTIIWTVMLGMLYPIRIAGIFTLIVVVLWFIQTYYLLGEPQWKAGSLYGSFHLFALLLAASNKSEAEMKKQYEANNRQLKATQHLLREASRQTERTRIARDLHDLLGHHLTALTIKLQVASRLSSDDSKEQIDDCHQIAKLLLNDVRDAVDTLRNNEEIDFRQALSILLDQVPELNIQLDIERWVTIDSLPVAQGLLRCIQESVTNTLKHSKATRMSVTISCDKDTITTRITDNGIVAKTLNLGNGLTGMRERVTQLNGTIEFETDTGAMLYVITLPRHESSMSIAS